MTCLSQVQLKEGGDIIKWSSDSKGVFSVKSCYKVLTQLKVYMRKGVGLPLKLIWDSKVLARINFFLWEVNMQALQTMVRLQQIFHDADTMLPDVDTMLHILVR